MAIKQAGKGVMIEVPTSVIVTEAITDHELQRALRPYATELGFINLYWNELHERLGYLFGIICAMPDKMTAFAVWHSQVSDRAQRAMLQAAIRRYHPRDRPLYVGEDLSWLLKQTDGLLSYDRNNAVHSPVAAWKVDGKVIVFPNWISGNRRANALKGSTFLKQLKLSKQKMLQLTNFAVEAICYLDGKKQVWPTKPKLPGRLEDELP